jgi:hypothetical protein
VRQRPLSIIQQVYRSGANTQELNFVAERPERKVQRQEVYPAA